MGKIFKRRKKNKPQSVKSKASRPRKVDTSDLVDPVLYLGGLDTGKYPQLPLENEKKEEEEVENPLNKR